MEIKPGFKQTQLGIIPDDWEVKKFSELAKIERGKFSARPRNDPKYYGGETPFLQTGDIVRSKGKISIFSQTLNAEGVKVSKVFPAKTLFFTIAANIGDLGISNFAAACPDSLVAIFPKSQIHKEWLFYELSNRKKDFENISTLSAQLNINLEKLLPYLLPVPKEAEQKAIANVLLDLDTLLEVLDKIIIKKRNLRQAISQQLLTGKTRLPGFKEKWVKMKISQISEYVTGVRTAGGDIGYVEIGDIDVDRKSYSLSHKEKLSVPGAVKVPSGTLLISTVRPTRGAIAVTESSLYVSSAFCRLQPKNAILYYLVCQPKFFEYLRVNSIGGTYPICRDETILDYETIIASDTNEQIAITSILSDINKELNAIEILHDKTQDLKQAMMQELLTGKTRLVKPEATHA
jgi:type I restriction enzyme S subunit